MRYGWCFASPVSHLDHHLLTAHMVAALLVMLVAAPFAVLLGRRLPDAASLASQSCGDIQHQHEA